ncbi:hypothetical protein CFHF_09195 [Caulobacter flavus]|uniref:Uncharacterized protein n=1 Tax=Caulobacter flavus TaxID=1679497 RepID=A0A2N5CUX6_9CAUL|nr:hypothetical protein CFHF_09195 [Caulobacter flavus]
MSDILALPAVFYDYPGMMRRCWVRCNMGLRRCVILAARGPLRPSGPPPPEGGGFTRRRCSPSGGAVAERLRGPPSGGYSRLNPSGTSGLAPALPHSTISLPHGSRKAWL